MKKVLITILIILIILVITGGAVGMYWHLKPVDPVGESLVLTTKDYGTFIFTKGKQISTTYDKGIPSRINGLLLPNTKLSAVILDNHYASNEIDAQSYKLVVIPEFDIESKTQNTNAGKHINYSEKINASVSFDSGGSGGGTLSDNIEAYILEDNIITYTKPYEDIPAEEKRFAIGFCKVQNEGSSHIYFWGDVMWQIGNDGEYMFFTSDTNCVFSQNLLFDFIMGEEE